MVLFDFPSLLLATKGDQTEMLVALEAFAFPNKAISQYSQLRKREYIGKVKIGTSFLINAYDLLAYDHAQEWEKTHYLVLASLRSLPDYTLLGITSLDFKLSPISKEYIEINKLLTITNNTVNFKYEKGK